MNIQTMLYGYRARASEDDLNEIRVVCEELLTIALSHSAFQPMANELEDEIESIDIDIEGLRREDRYAEQNAKYREDRPNA